MYSRWRKIWGFDNDHPVEDTGQMQSSFKEFEKKIKWRWYVFPYRKIESPHYEQAILRNPPTHPLTRIKIKANYTEIDFS